MNNNKNSETPKKILLFLLILFFIYLLFNYIYQQQQKLPETINSLEIRGHNVLTKDKILELLGIQSGISFKGLKYSQLEERLKMHPRIAKAEVSKKNKEQLLVIVEEKKTEFIIKSNNTLYEIDENFNLLSKDDVQERNTCIISGAFRIESNKIVGVRFKDLVESIRLAFKMFPTLKNRISEIVLSSDGEIVMYVYVPQKIKVYVGNHFPNKQARKLYATLAYFEREKISTRVLDLRGEDAVYH